MELDPLQAALARFASDLTVAGEPAVFDSVVERHLDVLLSLQAKGLRWPRVLKLLKQAGAQRSDGSDLSPDQFRASVSRAKRGRADLATEPYVLPAPRRSTKRVRIERVWLLPNDAHHTNDLRADAPPTPQPRREPPAKHWSAPFDPDL